jgi:hypothetical protein
LPGWKKEEEEEKEEGKGEWEIIHRLKQVKKRKKGQVKFQKKKKKKDVMDKNKYENILKLGERRPALFSHTLVLHGSTAFLMNLWSRKMKLPIYVISME